MVRLASYPCFEFELRFRCGPFSSKGDIERFLMELTSRSCYQALSSLAALHVGIEPLVLRMENSLEVPHSPQHFAKA